MAEDQYKEDVTGQETKILQNKKIKRISCQSYDYDKILKLPWKIAKEMSEKYTCYIVF
jgi:hypothetical protein